MSASSASTPSKVKCGRVSIYVRTSSEDQAERGTIQNQLDFLRNFVKLYGLDVADEYVDDGVTGTLALADRPEGRRLLEDARAGRFDEIIVYRLDRLGRTLRSLLDAHDQLLPLGVTIRSATEPFDTGTPVGTFLFQLLGGLAQLDRSTILERMTMGRDRVAKAGRWTGGPIPLGYDLNAEGHLLVGTRAIGASGTTEADLARSIFARIATRETTSQSECLRLNATGVPCFRRYAGGKEVIATGEWFPSRLRQMIRNPIYKGVHVFASKAGRIERAVPSLVAEDVWQRANEQLTQNRNVSTRETTRLYLLRGLIQCGTCGHAYVGNTSHGSGQIRSYYRCSGQLAASRPKETRCHNQGVRSDDLEASVWQDCREIIQHPGKYLADAQKQLRARMETSASVETQRQEILEQIGDKDTERERTMTLFRRGRSTLEETETQLDAVTAETAELRRLLDAIRAQEALTQAFENQVTEAASLFDRMQGELEEIERTDDRPRKRQIMQLLVSRIVMRYDEAPQVRYVFSPQREPINRVISDTTDHRSVRRLAGRRRAE